MSGNTEVADLIERYIGVLVGFRECGVGMTLVGPPGVGKTTLAAAILAAAARDGYAVCFCPLEQWVRRNLAEIRTYNAAQYDEWNRIRAQHKWLRNTADFVVFDDIGKEHRTGSGFAEHDFEFTLRYRFDRGLPTILTTNDTMEDWNERYHISILSFLSEACPSVVVTGPDLRGV